METSWAVLGRSWGPRGPSSSIGSPKRRESQTHRKKTREVIDVGLSGLSSPVYVCCVRVLYMLYFCTHVRLCECRCIRMNECMHACKRMHACVLVCMRVSTGLRPLPPPCLGGGSLARAAARKARYSSCPLGWPSISRRSAATPCPRVHASRGTSLRCAAAALLLPRLLTPLAY